MHWLDGCILAETSKADDDIVIADLNPSLLASSTGRMWMAARRPDFSSPRNKFTSAVGRNRPASIDAAAEAERMKIADPIAPA